MPDLEDRFRSLARTPVPELWDEAEVRPPRPLTPSPRGPRFVAGVTALLVAAAGFVVAARAFQESAPVTRETPAEARIVFSAGRGEQIDLFSMKPDGSDIRRLTDTPSSEDQPASSPDGSRLAFAAREPGEPASFVVGVMNADGSGRAEIPGTRLEGGNPVGDPAWSPDAAEIAFTAYGDGGGIYAADVYGGPPRRLTEAGPPTIYVDSDPEWSPSGDSIAFIRWVLGDATEQPAYEILQVPATGGDTSLVARVAAPTEENPNRGVFESLSWSPDGSRLAFAMDGAIHTIDLVGGEPVEVVSCEELGCVDGIEVITDATAWSPDGLRIAFTAWADVPTARDEPPLIYVAAAFADEASVVSTGVGGLFPTWQRADSGPSESTTRAGSIDTQGQPLREGSLLLQVEDHVETLEEGAGTSTVVATEAAGFDVSPDGTQVLVSTPWESVGPVAPLRSLDLDSGGSAWLVEPDGWSLPARWSPDGSRLAYIEGDDYLLCILDLVVLEPRCLPELGRVYEFDWSPDGTRLVLDRAPIGQLTIVDAATGVISTIARWDDGSVSDAVREVGLGDAVGIQFQGPRWSPSGRSLAALAMVRTEEGHSGNVLLVFDLEGNVVASGQPGGEFLRERGWSPTADVIAYARGREPPYQVIEARVLDPTSGEDRLILSTIDTPSQKVFDLAWSPSGRWLAVLLTQPSEIRVLDVTGDGAVATHQATGVIDLIGWAP